MRARITLLVAIVAVSSAAMVQAPRHLNPVVDLLAQKKAVFGLYAPANRRPGRGGVVPADAPPPKSASELAREALANETADYLFDGTMEGLAKVREIAAVKGIGVLFPGAGTLRGVFSTTDAAGQRVLDEVAWEAAIQQVLAACKEFNVPCGYPANATDIEKRIQQGFSVFVIGWGEQGFKAVEIGRKAVGR